LTNPERPYFENLDALRFLAACSVFIFHLGRELGAFFSALDVFSEFIWLTKITDKGALGVNFFFVLSGFLITYLMIWEYKIKGTFSYKKFLVRRTLRIWPLYFLVVFIGFVLFPLLIKDYETNHKVVNYLIFCANFDEIWFGASDSVNFLTSPWSIAVEEQFYVVWGLVGTIFLRMARANLGSLKSVIYLFLIVSFAFRWQHAEDSRTLYYSTLAVMPDLLVGCLLAIFWHENPEFFNRMRSVKTWKSIIIYILGFSLILLKNAIFSGALVVIERYILAFFFAYVIADQVVHRRSLPVASLHNKALKLGKISYGIYMFHLIIMYLFNVYWFKAVNFSGDRIGLVLLSALFYSVCTWVAVVMVSKFSFSYFESPFLRIKTRFE
jgi:peptidoglycan/LPS O-acetylase OafA/YrhL